MVSEGGGYAKYKCASNNAHEEFRNLCRNHQNIGLMMWANAQD